MLRFLKSLGMPVAPAPYYPDYFPDAPNARVDRSILCETFDGRELGAHFLLMREQYARFKILNRYAMDVLQFFSISTRGPGWIRTFLKMAWTYWSDVSTCLPMKSVMTWRSRPMSSPVFPSRMRRPYCAATSSTPSAKFP